MKNKPLVSVVMPTYNQVQFIEEAIASVLNQTYANIELIIIDNYSDDGTADMIASLNTKNVMHVLFKNHGVIAASRNKGIEVAQGDFIAFIDSDDAWHLEKIERQMAIMLKEPKTALVTSYYKVVGSSKKYGGKIMGPKHHIGVRSTYEHLLNRNFISTSSCLVRGDILKSYQGFNESPDLRCVEDYDLWLRIAYEHDVAFVDQPLTFYREHDANTSHSTSMREKVFRVLGQQYHKKRIDLKQLGRLKAAYFIREGFFIIEKQPREARGYFATAFSFISVGAKIKGKATIGWVLSFCPYVYIFLYRYIKKS